jgi:hypothetical protein
MFVAVFAAAFLGNMYHHILLKPDTVLNLDPVLFWDTWGPRLIYCALLATGIWVSMLRQQKIRAGAGPRPGLFFTLRRIAGVWTFYGIILIFNKTPNGLGISAATKYFLNLFGL